MVALELIRRVKQTLTHGWARIFGLSGHGLLQ
jgi:hypothetical protein